MTRKSLRTINDKSGKKEVTDIKGYENKNGGGKGKKPPRKGPTNPKRYRSPEPIEPRPPRKTRVTRPKEPKDKKIFLLLMVPILIIIILDIWEPTMWISIPAFYISCLSIIYPIYAYREDPKKIKADRNFNRKVILVSPVLILFIVLTGFQQIFERFSNLGLFK